MGPDVLHRVRWRNLARAGAAVAVVAAVVAWPRVGPPEPRVPEAGAVPLVEPAATPGETEAVPPVEPVATPVVRERVRPRRKREPRRRRRAIVRDRAGAGRAESAPSEQSRPPVAPPAAPRIAPPSADPVQEEFGIEGG